MPEPLQENIDFYYNEENYFVFTESYHKKRGYCCKSGCLHCPYNYQKEIENSKKEFNYEKINEV
jgi:hypothetical protein